MAERHGLAGEHRRPIGARRELNGVLAGAIPQRSLPKPKVDIEVPIEIELAALGTDAEDPRTVRGDGACLGMSGEASRSDRQETLSPQRGRAALSNDLDAARFELLVHELLVLCLRQVLVTGETLELELDLFHEVLNLGVFFPLSCLVVRSPIDDFEPSGSAVYGVTEAVIAGVVGDSVDEPVLNGLKDRVEETVLYIIRLWSEFRGEASCPESSA